jgi:hypothetical protein
MLTKNNVLIAEAMSSKEVRDSVFEEGAGLGGGSVENQHHRRRSAAGNLGANLGGNVETEAQPGLNSGMGIGGT